MWLTLSGVIYSRIAHLTINLQESEIYFCNFTNQLSQWFTVTIISQLRWYGRGKANQQLDCDNYFLVYSGWNLKSTLLVIPLGFITKTKNKETSQGSYNTSGDSPWKPDAYLHHSALFGDFSAGCYLSTLVLCLFFMSALCVFPQKKALTLKITRDSSESDTSSSL